MRVISMSRLEHNLDYEISWRTGEIATLRKLIKSNKLTERQLDFVKKYSIASIYSIWEGFVVTSFQHYIEEINNLNLKTNEIHLNILTHTIDLDLNLKDGRSDFSKKCKFINRMAQHLSEEKIKIPNKIPAGSNVNYSVLLKIYECYNFNNRLDEKYEHELNDFLRVRNDIAHGEFSIVVSDEMIDRFSFLVQELMSEVAQTIYNEFQSESFKK